MNVDWVCHIRVDIVNASRGYHIEIREAHNNHESKKYIRQSDADIVDEWIREK